MTAVVLTPYAGASALQTELHPVPKPGKNEVLVKVAASPINPSDLSFLEGRYAFKKPTTAVPGFEGSGTVVAVGPGIGMMTKYLVGKRVACVSQAAGEGVWADYMVTSSNFAFPLDAEVSLEQGASSAVNPLTALALLSIAKISGHKAFVHTAAASALGQMVNRLSKVEGIQVIHVARRESQVQFLKEQGAEIVLKSSSPNFEKELRDACHQHQAHLAFDTIAGEMTLKLLKAMQSKSKINVYGGLSFKSIQANPEHLIFQDKVVDGFWLTTWIGKKNFLQSLRLWRNAQKLIPTVLNTKIRSRYSLQDAKKGVQEYQNQMTGGKVLLVPGQ